MSTMNMYLKFIDEKLINKIIVDVGPVIRKKS